MAIVDPDYLKGNGTGQYIPERWVDESKDVNTGAIVEEGTVMDAVHFNHMENGIHNNAIMLAVLLEQMMHNIRAISSAESSLNETENKLARNKTQTESELAGIKEQMQDELIQVELTNDNGFYDNNSAKTVALSKMKKTLNYHVYVESQGDVVNAGKIVIYDKQLNGFKIRFTGSAKSVTVKCYVHGGVSS